MCRMVPPGVHTCSPFEEGILHAWVGGVSGGGGGTYMSLTDPQRRSGHFEVCVRGEIVSKIPCDFQRFSGFLSQTITGAPFPLPKKNSAFMPPRNPLATSGDLALGGK